ncbi:MAG: hypothetical protein QOI66_3430 [Myxococcales bacterium]|jgi:hypothetical protein|nr:hypothetical protein [Myxococcales bacterium]
MTKASPPSPPTLGALLLAVTVWGVACAHPGQGPAASVTAFAAAMDRRDYQGAYALTSADYQKRVPLAAFRLEVDAAVADARPMAARLAPPPGASAPRVWLELADGDTLPLVQEGGAWHIDAPPLEPFPRRTPRAALRSFVRALEQRRYDVLVRFAPSRYRAGLTAEKLRQMWEGEGKGDNQKLLAELRANLNAPIVELGDEAHMPYGEHEVHFLREEGAWTIADPD